MELMLIKTPTGLIPMGHDSTEKYQKLKQGQVYRIELTRPRNPKFHRKFMALIGIGFDAWEPPQREHCGLVLMKNFERFRKDVVIATGRYDAHVNLRGEARLEAHSIAFGNMAEDEFEQLYSDAIDVLLQRVLSHYRRRDLEQVVENILRFDS